MAPLAVLSSSNHINLLHAARFVKPLFMERIICWIHHIFHITSVCTGHLIHKVIAPSMATAAR